MKALQRMTKVHPNLSSLQPELPQVSSCRREETEVLTVWRKSLLFNCSGFTVYDAKGNLVFRVDNYGSGSGSNNEVVLMDAAGKPLLSVRRKRQLSLGDHCVIYNGEDFSKPLLSVKRHAAVRHTKSLTEVTPFFASPSSSSFVVEGSYAQRCCVFVTGEGQQVAEVRRKEVANSGGSVKFGDDVFQLVVKPEIDTCLAMGIVIALDHMAASRRSWSWS